MIESGGTEKNQKNRVMVFHLPVEGVKGRATTVNAVPQQGPFLQEHDHERDNEQRHPDESRPADLQMAVRPIPRSAAPDETDYSRRRTTGDTTGAVELSSSFYAGFQLRARGWLDGFEPVGVLEYLQRRVAIDPDYHQHVQ